MDPKETFNDDNCTFRIHPGDGGGRVTSTTGGPVSEDEIRALLHAGRAAVLALRDAAVEGGGPAEQMWFEKWRAEAVIAWNRLIGYLIAGDHRPAGFGWST